jgi:Transposase domain (DUF772)/Transposase DDE domain
MWSWMGENYMAVVLDRERPMALGLARRQGDLLDDVTRFCDQALPEASVYGLLHRERDRLFPDELFADLFSDRGRRCVPPSVVATVMVLQRLEGLSDREAVERYTFDARWRYAAGVGGYGSGGWGRFAHTVLVDMRERLRRSDRPDRVFEVALAAAKQAGLVGRRRVLDSTPLYDAVATMDTVTLIRSALRGLLAVADQVLEAELRAVLASGDDYASAAKPQIDWDDPAAREQLVDSRAKDAFSCLGVLDGRQLAGAVAEAAALLATVVGQDLEEGEDRVVRIARKVAADRVISTVDPDARHGHKTAARGFDGYKGHAAVDPDSELITATKATPGNAGDASVAADLIEDLLADEPAGQDDPASQTGEANAPARQPDQGADAPQPPKVYGGLRLRHRRVPVHPGGPPHRLRLQDSAAQRCRWAPRQGSLRHRPRLRHRHLPRRARHGDPPGHRWRRHRLLRRGVRRLPAAGPVHQRRGRAHHPGRSLRGRARPGPPAPG